MDAFSKNYKAKRKADKTFWKDIGVNPYLAFLLFFVIFVIYIAFMSYLHELGY
ncbi:hypothetical protein JO84_gp336 [Aureococcus anophagefferens virus]|uniref:Uncharacterized protein n=1 Tax=Aureococcus anophagefferens virus TaxID=1474867 RepID=A0A076FFH3_9VIRU|nr:hypothetical protein JO84_gp336 [Aureococcus anophagefferens virus]AII16994.1 hypothetical protein AaV_137 [Aureococcus anophagefferens virus]UOG94051.1 hypothetical protein MKD35_9 [Aureococcus anophagefferens virus]